jgi:sugar phosphate isomerase/epimerase
MILGARGHDILESKASAKTLADAMTAAKTDTVQLVCHKSIEGVEYAPGSLTKERAGEIGRGFSGRHIALIGAYFNPVHPNAEAVENGIAVFKDNLEYAKIIGCDTVGSETGSYKGDPWTYHPQNRTPEALRNVVEIFSSLAEYAAGFGANVGVEGAAGHVCYDVKALKSAVDSIGGNTKVIFDYYNFCEDGNADYVRILDEGLSAFPEIHCFHIKDFLDGSLEQVPVGKGSVDFSRVLSMIKQYDKDAALILEGTPPGEIARSAAFLREIWEAIG